MLDPPRSTIAVPLQAAVLILLAPITPANADHSWNVAYMNISLICTLMC